MDGLDESRALSDVTLLACFWLAHLFPKLAGRVWEEASRPAQKGPGFQQGSGCTQSH